MSSLPTHRHTHTQKNADKLEAAAHRVRFAGISRLEGMFRSLWPFRGRRSSDRVFEGNFRAHLSEGIIGVMVF